MKFAKLQIVYNIVWCSSYFPLVTVAVTYNPQIPFVHLSSYLGIYGTEFVDNIASFTPGGRRPPECASRQNSTYCNYIDSYPSDKIKSLLTNYVRSSKYFDLSAAFTSGADRIRVWDTPWRQVGTYRGVPVCEAVDEMACPQVAINTNGQWKYVVNINDEQLSPINQVGGVKPVQCYRIQKCRTNDGRCNNKLSIPQGYLTRCEQRYVVKQVITLGIGGERLVFDKIWFPSSCSCVLYTL
ncbi:Uncharacterised protein g5671 [Pycnogonum litorale]